LLTIWGCQRRLCDGIRRRDFLHLGLLSGALTLPDLLRLRAEGATVGRSSHKAIIMVCLNGGPSHIDMYDLKPRAPIGFAASSTRFERTFPALKSQS
jgi:hypothetical protein